MSGFVVDATVAVTWLFEDRARPDCDALQLRVTTDRGVAPELWRWEVASVWLKKSRRDGLTDRDVATIGVIFAYFSGFVTLETASEATFRAAIQLARRHRLSAYDAAYLELAVRRRLPLATLDRALIRAAEAERMPVLPAPA